MKKATIILSHGSKNEKSNKQFKQLVEKINNGNEDCICCSKIQDFKKSHIIRGAFLELAEPIFEKVIEEIVDNGIKNITILPLFFFAGYHVREDIPERIIDLKNNYSDLNFTLLEPIGLSKEFPEFIKEQLLLR